MPTPCWQDFVCLHVVVLVFDSGSSKQQVLEWIE
jgi:hypothetical protein